MWHRRRGQVRDEAPGQPVAGEPPEPAPQPGAPGDQGDPPWLNAPGNDWSDAYEGIPRRCCCPTGLKILGNGPSSGVAGSARTFLLRDDAPGRVGSEPYAGHSFRVQFTWEERPYGDNEDCTLIWKEISDKAIAGWQFVGGKSQSYELPSEEWHDLKELNPRSGVFEEWNHVFGAAAAEGYPAVPPSRGDARKNPEGPGYVLDLPDDPMIPNDPSTHRSRELEGEVTVLAGCFDCLPITVRFRQVTKWRDRKVVANFFTHTGDTSSQVGPQSPFAASTTSHWLSKLAYAAWKHQVHKAWNAGGNAWGFH